MAEKVITDRIIGRVINPTFPRSGWNYHIAMLRDYFGQELRLYESHIKQGDPDKANYIKNHDFQLRGHGPGSESELLKDNTFKHVILYRHPLESIASHYSFVLKNNPKLINHNDCSDSWLAFYNEGIEYWRKFVQKWVLNSEELLSKKVIRYRDLVANTEEVMSDLILFLTEVDNFDRNRLKSVVAKHKRETVSDLRDFCYFDEEFFIEEEAKLLQSHLAPLGIEPLFSMPCHGENNVSSMKTLGKSVANGRNIEKKPISKVGPVVVSTGPKVGSTWVCNILQELGLTLATGHNGQADIFSDINPSILDLSKDATQRFISSSIETCLYKSHSPAPDWIEDCPTSKFITIYRDPRDLLVSLAFYGKLRGEQGNGRVDDPALDIPVANTISNHINDINSGRSYVNTIRSWVGLDSANVLALRYEDLHSDALDQVRRIVDFLGADCRDADLIRAIDSVSFEKKANGRKRGEENGNSFYRKGIVGDWKNYFNGRIVEEYKSTDNGLWNKLLIGLDYEADLAWQLPNKLKTIAFVHNWPGAKNSELDLMQRMKDLARKRGVNCVNISPYGDILDDQGDFLDDDKIIDPQSLEFVLNFHYTSPNYIDNFSYMVNWNPLNYVINNPVNGEGLDSEHVAYLSSCFQSHDFLLSAQSQEMDDFAKCLNVFDQNNSNVVAGPLHTTCNIVDSDSFPTLDKFKVFYISANWERQYKVQRHGSLLELIDQSGNFELFGLREQNGVYLWDGIDNYKGQLPFDGGKSIIKESNRCGVSLVLHSQAHRDSCLVSTRIFQAAAAKTVIISDDNPWIVENFGDSVLTFSYRFGDDQWNYSQISRHIEWIRKNPDEALLRAKEAHRIFVDKFSLDHEFSHLLDLHQVEVQRFETDLCAKKQSACVDVVYEYDRKTINRYVADLEGQHLVTPVAVFLVSGDGRDELTRYLKLRKPNFKWRIVCRSCSERLGDSVYHRFFEAMTPYLTYYHPQISWNRYHLSMLVRKLENGASIAHCASYVQNVYLQEGKLNDYFVSSQAAMGGYAKAVRLMDLVRFNVDDFSPSTFMFKKECFTALGNMLLPVKFFDRGFYLCLIAIAYEEFGKLPAFIGRFNAKFMREDPYWTIQNYDEQARMTSRLERTVFLSFFKNCQFFRESPVSDALGFSQQQPKEQHPTLPVRSAKYLKRMRLFKVYYDLKRSGLFLKDYYLKLNPDVAELGGDVLWHFIVRGAYEGRNPNPYFDSRYYLKFNPEVAAIGINPLFHYLRHGATEGRNPSSKFNTVLYVQSNPEIIRKRLNPLAHYLRYGVGDDKF